MVNTDLVITFGGSFLTRLKIIWSLSGIVCALLFYKEAKLTLEDADLLKMVKKN
jgi:hypothetical protein